MDNIFEGLNENMATIVANTTAGGFTPANLFINLLSDKNSVSEYFKNQSNIKSIVLDFKKQHDNQTADRGYQNRLESVLKKVSADTEDRYINEITFMSIILNDNKLSKVFNNIVGKYLKPEYVKEDFERMLAPQPNMAVSYTHLTLPTICSV